MPTVTRAALWTVYVVMLMDTLNFGIVFPLMPSIAKDFGASATAVGAMATTYSMCQMIATPFIGRASDRFGRRPVVLVSLLGTTLSSLGTGLAWNFPLLVVARCVNGLSGATMGVVSAYVADVTSAEEKPIYMSYISAFNSVGIVLGPALGGVLAKKGFSVACYTSAAFSALNLLAAMAFLAESRWHQATELLAAGGGAREVRQGGGGEAAAGADMGAQQPTRVPCAAYYLFVSGFLLILGFASVESITGYYLMDTFYSNLPEKEAAAESGQFYGLCFTLVGICAFCTGTFIYRPFYKRVGWRPLVVVGTILRAFGFLCQPLAPSKELFAAAWMFIVAGTNCIIPTTSSLLTTISGPGMYGRALGYQQGAQGLARTIGPTVFGAVYDKVDHAFSFHICAGSTLIAGILIFMVPSPGGGSQQERPSAADVEENIETHDREEPAPPSADVTPMHCALVRKMSRTMSNGEEEDEEPSERCAERS